MKYLCKFLSFIVGIFSYTIINGQIQPKQDYYISSQLSLFHKECVTDTIDYFNKFDFLRPINLVKQEDYNSKKDIRISYYELNDPHIRKTSSTEFRGHLTDGNKWSIDWMDVKLNRDIQYDNLCNFLVLHELLHTRGLYHSDNPNSFMNKTVYIKNGVVQDTDIEYLQWDDIQGLLFVD